MKEMADTTLIDRAVIRLSPTAEGEDVRGFLQGLVTNDVLGPLPVWAGLLTPQGKALFDFLVWESGSDLLIDCEADQADALVKRLSMYRLRKPIAIARDEGLAVHWALDSAEGVPDPRDPRLGKRWIAPRDPFPIKPVQADRIRKGLTLADDHSNPDKLESLRNPLGDSSWSGNGLGGAATGWHAHRLSLGIVEGVAELGQDKTLWLEANAREQNGVSFTKGCYIGQENTARMNYRQKVNRRLAVVPLPPEPSDKERARYPELGLAVVVERVADEG
jgi:tRNA-modifying protein YgfZ